MLTENNYQRGLTELEEMKYTIEYNKLFIMTIVCSGLAQWLLDHEYSADLTDEQRSALECITSK